MLERRIVVVCDRDEVGDSLRSALEIQGWAAVVVAPSDVVPHQLTDARFVVAVDDASALADLVARLRGAARAVIVLRAPSMPSTIEWLSASAHVVAVITLDAFDGAAPALDVRPVELAHVLPAGTEVQTHVIADDHARRVCLAQLAQHAAHVGVPTRLQRAIEQACDELITNALYAAPVDRDGSPLFGDLSTTDRVRYRTDAVVTTRLGGNDKLFALSVRDEYGSLQRMTALAFLHKGIHAADKVDQRLAGAGLGLYLIASECAAMHIHIERGIATEIVCVFQVGAERQELRQLSVVSADGNPEEIAARARSRSPVLRSTRAGAAMRTWVLYGAIATLAAGVAGVVGWRTLRSTDDAFSLAIATEPAGATVTVDGRVASGSPARVEGVRSSTPVVITVESPGYVGRRVVAHPRRGQSISVALLRRPPTLDVDSTPPGATALLDGTPVGETPLVLTELPAGREVSITLRRQGFADAIVRTVVPPAGERGEIREQLSPAPGYARVHIDSVPLGARIVDASGGLGKRPIFTPADLVLSTTDEHRFVLVMPRHLPAALPPFQADAGLSRSAVLEPVPVIQIETDRVGTATIVDVAHCATLEIPAECPVSPGTYQVEIRAAGHPTVRHTATVGDHDVVIRYGGTGRTR